MTVREKRLWIAAAALLLLIYSTLYLVRGPIEFLRRQGLLSLTVTAIFVVAAIVVGRFLWRRRPGPREVAVLALFALFYLWALAVTERPEERLHLLEYGALAALVHAALVERRRGRGGAAEGLGLAAALGAAVAVGLCGWLDEGIQHLLPNRYYDLRDVALNFGGALLAIGAIQGAERARRRDTAARS